MQNPPGPPEPSGPPPAMASSGMDKKTASALSYLLWWITGIIFLFVGKDDPDVKYHAAQSVVFFGSIQVIGIILGILSGITNLGFIGVIGNLVYLFGVVIWFFCLYKAWTGDGARFAIPLVGGVVTPYAEQLAARV
ncbi:MAG TPA: DUF4870 domain-containing protein [Candidatus Dormibacteraeota bacterium]|jgi:uncharacterized membrane protein